jgi:beta-1,4-N-acetylgalactosaminyltransferase 4
MKHDAREQDYQHPLVPDSEIEGTRIRTIIVASQTHVSARAAAVLPRCDKYNPSYVIHRRVHTYEGVNLIRGTFVYPDDHTGRLWHPDKHRFDDGNPVLDSSRAMALAMKYWNLLEKKVPHKFKRVQVVNVEMKPDETRNSHRYLVEMHVRYAGEDNGPVHRLSDYVVENGDGSLCRPFTWNKESRVNIVIPVKNQGRWVKHLIRNMEEIFALTQERHLRLVLVDYASDDLDIEAELKKSKLNQDQWILVKRTGPFERAGGLQHGVDAIQGDDEIIYACDLHLDMPPMLVESVRKHCIKGVMAYAPIVVRLDCDASPTEPTGRWETAGYGLFGMFKSDWQAVGGMDTSRFRDKWGGEDWDFLDRTMSNAFDVERLRIPHFFHNYHSHAGMWGDKTLF